MCVSNLEPMGHRSQLVEEDHSVQEEDRSGRPLRGGQTPARSPAAEPVENDLQAVVVVTGTPSAAERTRPVPPVVGDRWSAVFLLLPSAARSHSELGVRDLRDVLRRPHPASGRPTPGRQRGQQTAPPDRPVHRRDRGHRQHSRSDRSTPSSAQQAQPRLLHEDHGQGDGDPVRPDQPSQDHTEGGRCFKLCRAH